MFGGRFVWMCLYESVCVCVYVRIYAENFESEHFTLAMWFQCGFCAMYEMCDYANLQNRLIANSSDVHNSGNI